MNMSLTQRHVSLYKESRWGSNFNYKYSDQVIIEKNNKKAEIRMDKHIYDIMQKIMKIEQSKNEQIIQKFQINGYHEYKILKLFLDNYKNIQYNLIFDDKLTRSVVDEINATDDNGCCYDCGRRMSYSHIKVPVMYIKVTKIKINKTP